MALHSLANTFRKTLDNQKFGGKALKDLVHFEIQFIKCPLGDHINWYLVQGEAQGFQGDEDVMTESYITQ